MICMFLSWVGLCHDKKMAGSWWPTYTCTLHSMKYFVVPLFCCVYDSSSCVCTVIYLPIFIKVTSLSAIEFAIKSMGKIDHCQTTRNYNITWSICTFYGLYYTIQSGLNHMRLFWMYFLSYERFDFIIFLKIDTMIAKNDDGTVELLVIWDTRTPIWHHCNESERWKVVWFVLDTKQKELFVMSQ